MILPYVDSGDSVLLKYLVWNLLIKKCNIIKNTFVVE